MTRNTPRNTRNTPRNTRNTPRNTRNPPTDTLPDAAPPAVENPWRFWTIPNILSLIRLAMLAPTVWALVTRHNLLAFILFVVSSATDAVDGWVARRLKQESEWGKILDPIADKLTLNTLAMIMAFQGRIPLFLALVVLVRDAVILGGGLVLLTSRTFLPQSSWAGKVTGLAFFTMLCAGLLDARWLLQGFLVPLVTVLVFITLVGYAYAFLQNLKPKSEEE
jgi:cardiolipin synthase